MLLKILLDFLEVLLRRQLEYLVSARRGGLLAFGTMRSGRIVVVRPSLGLVVGGTLWILVGCWYSLRLGVTLVIECALRGILEDLIGGLDLYERDISDILNCAV